MIAAKEAAKYAAKYIAKEGAKKGKAVPKEALKEDTPLRELQKELMKKKVKQEINKRLADKKPKGMFDKPPKPKPKPKGGEPSLGEKITKPLKNEKGEILVGKRFERSLSPTRGFLREGKSTVPIREGVGAKHAILPSRLKPKKMSPNAPGQTKGMGTKRKDQTHADFEEEMINKDIDMGNTGSPWKPKGK